jgi:hypothetical protein
MSFQAYLDNIQAKTGKSVAEFQAMAAERGFTEGGTLKKGVKAGAILDWLKTEFDLGRGHGMAIVSVLKGESRG